MNEEDAKRFIDSGITDVTIVAIKNEGYWKGKYILYLVGYLKELKGIVAQSDSWNEEELVSEIDISYGCMRQYFIDKHGLKMPLKLNYSIEYVSQEEFFAK